jgi:sterol desaturase/sphingolipid hydroxylase (fatty acid hydroxylase superfamily)
MPVNELNICLQVDSRILVDLTKYPRFHQIHHHIEDYYNCISKHYIVLVVEIDTAFLLGLIIYLNNMEYNGKIVM